MTDHNLKRHHHVDHNDNFKDVEKFKVKALASIKYRKKLSKWLLYILILIAVIMLVICIFVANDDTAPNQFTLMNISHNFLSLI